LTTLFGFLIFAVHEIKILLHMENAPRYCSITNEPMWEGWYFEGIDMYVKYEDDAKRICTNYEYATLALAFADDFMYWTDWHSEPESEWHEAGAPEVH